jgi:FAD synthase
VGFLRGEEKFSSAEALIEQMHRDAVAALEILAAPMDPLALSAIG